MKMLKALVLGAALTVSGTAFAQSTDYVLLPGEKFSLTAVNSAGSGANVQALSAGTADFAILQGLFGSYAVTGTGPVTEPQANLRSVTMLWQNVEQFVMPTEKATTGTVGDLTSVKGMSVGMGKQNSGTMGSNKVLLGGLGLTLEDFTLVSVGYGPTADAMANGQAVAAGMPSGPPTGAITKLMASNEGKLQLPWTVVVTFGCLTQSQLVHTQVMYENLPFLQAIHPATKAMAVEKAMAGLPAPLHPGAARYYTEMGLDIPAHLIAK